MSTPKIQILGLLNYNKRIENLETEVANLLYEAISISSFTNNIGNVEMGSTITNVTLAWKFNKVPETVTLDGVAKAIDSTGETITGLSITSNKSWTLVATDERGATSTKKTTLSFLNGVYYGVSNLTEITDDNGVLASFRDALTKDLRSDKLTSFSVNADEGEYIYYLLPKRMGTCSFNVGGFDGGFGLIDTANLTNASGYPEEYYIYRSDNLGLGQTTVKVS